MVQRYMSRFPHIKVPFLTVPITSIIVYPGSILLSPYSRKPPYVYVCRSRSRLVNGATIIIAALERTRTVLTAPKPKPETKVSSRPPNRNTCILYMFFIYLNCPCATRIAHYGFLKYEV